MKVKTISYQELNLSPNALRFVQDYEPQLNKPYVIGCLPNDYEKFGFMSDDGRNYFIGIRLDVPQEDLEANFCHELFHAYQMSKGFPTVTGHEQDTEKYCERLRSTILDLSANDALKQYQLTYESVVKTRLKQCKRLCATSFREINNQFAKDLLAVDLILDLSDFTKIQCENILRSLQHNLPDVFQKYFEYHNVVFEENDYRTPGGCLNIFSHFLNDIGLWFHCSIFYLGEEIFTPQKLNWIIEPTEEE